MTLRQVSVTRYVTPLREGGSLPAIVEADDLGLYVAKFRAAGQGSRALVAELIVGELARALGFTVPEIVFVELPAAIGRAEPDPEIQELVLGSVGTNLALDYLPGSITFNPAADTPPSAELAANLVWFDSFVTNPDRMPQNPNLLVWHGQIWLIDHGAALYVHHGWADPDAHARQPFDLVDKHVLLPFSGRIEAAHERLAPLVTSDLIATLAAQVPDTWLADDAHGRSADEQRAAYVHYIESRLAAADAWVGRAMEAQHG